jgi:hypothetical protein
MYLTFTLRTKYLTALVKQARCVHIRLFYEEKSAGNCKGLPSRREGLFRSSWYVFVMFFATPFLYFLFVCKDYCLLSRLCFLAAIDAPGGFLFEWWSVFWDIFIARTNEKHSDVAASYIEVSVYNICLSFYGKTLNGQGMLI